MKKSLLVVAVAAIVLSGCSFPGGSTQSDKANASEKNQSTSTATPEPKIYTMEEVAKHASKDDCWMVVEGKVYDITKMTKAATHPGGEAVLKGCGVDGTELFNARPGDNRPHSQQAKQSLKTFLIGDLKK